MTLAGGFKVPKWFTVESLGKYAGCGEDDPIWSTRLERDGWTLVRGKAALLWEKPHPIAPGRFTLHMHIREMSERGGRWYVIEHSISGAHDLGRSEWAGWSHAGDLLYSK